MDLRGRYPQDTYQYLVTTDGNQLFTGTGSLITSLLVASITSSQVTESYATESYIKAISLVAENITASTGIFANPNLDVYGSSNSPIFSIIGNSGTGGKTGQISVTPSGMTIDTTGTLIFINKTLQLGTSNIQSTNNASSFFGTSSAANTASYLFVATSSAPPANTASVVAWLNITVNNSIFKFPLYQ